MSSDSRNIVLVSIDSLRGDHCGYLGDERGLTPTMDRLAEAGVAYETAVAPGPQTFSTLPAIMTGQKRPPTSLEEYPQESHWGRRLAAIDEHLRNHATLAEHLQEVGYETAAITPNPWTSAAAGFDRGFDVFEDFSKSDSTGLGRTIVGRLPVVHADSRPVELVLNMLSGREFFAEWGSLTERIEKAREQLTEPYFLWVFILDTHFPFLPSRTHREEQSALGMYYSTYRSASAMRGNGGTVSEHVRQSVMRSYRDTIRASDAFLDYLLAEVAEDDPALLVHSDHGESFGDHGNYGHHHRDVFEENIHVPYVVHNAGASTDIDAPTSLSSIYDTTLEIARNGTFEPTATTERGVVAASECGTNRAVRGNRFKYLEQGDDHRLFDLERDPGELRNIAGDRPRRCREFRRVLSEFDGHTTETRRVQRATAALASQEQL